jgi:hypothetical protein
MLILIHYTYLKPLNNASRFTLLACLFFLLACSSSNQTNQTKSQEPVIQPVLLHLPDSGIGKIVFLSFDMSVIDSAKDSYQFILKNKQFVEGQLKAKNLLHGNAMEPQYLYCEIANSSGEKSPMIPVPNPLYRVYEYPADEKNALNKITLTHKQGELFVRFQWQPNDTYLSIYKPSLDLLTFKQIYYAKF